VLARTFEAVFVVIKFAGVAYLLFLAWKMWFAPAQVREDALPSARSPVRMFTAGLTITLGNPKIMIFYLALLPTIVDLSRVSLHAWLELVATMLVVLASTDSFWVLVAARARKLLTNRRAVKISNRASATMMAGAAVVIATR